MNVHIEGEGTVSTGEERTRTASIRDVARAADVSYQTVSRVLNGHPSIRPETKQRVLDAMAELRYRPNQAARALVTSRSRTIGVILGSRGEYGPTSSLAALEDAARARGYWVTSAYLGDTRPEAIRAAVDHLRRQAVEGIVVHAPQVRVFDVLEELDIGIPHLGLHTAQRGIAEIAEDQVHGARLATEHLIGLGHVEIVHVAGPQMRSTSTPSSASVRVATGPAMTRVRSRTRTPRSGARAVGAGRGRAGASPRRRISTSGCRRQLSSAAQSSGRTATHSPPAAVTPAAAAAVDIVARRAATRCRVSASESTSSASASIRRASRESPRPSSSAAR